MQSPLKSSHIVSIPNSPIARLSPCIGSSSPRNGSLVVEKSTLSKLEVMYSHEMSHLIHFSLLLGILSIVGAVVGVLSARLWLSTESAARPFPKLWLILEISAMFCISCILIWCMLYFCTRLSSSFVNGRTIHQAITKAYIVLLVPALIPFRTMAEALQQKGLGPSPAILIIGSICELLSYIATMLYIWTTFQLCTIDYQACLVGFRLREYLLNARFFIAGLILLSLNRMVGTLAFKIIFAPLPFQTSIGLAKVLSLNQAISRKQQIVIIIDAVLQAAVLLCLYRCYSRANASYAKSDLTEHRFESIMYRFYKTSLQLLCMPLLIYIVLQFAYPTSQIISYQSTRHYLITDPAIGKFAIALSATAFAIRQGFVNLPEYTTGKPHLRAEESSHQKLQMSESGEMKQSKVAALISADTEHKIGLAVRLHEKHEGEERSAALDPDCFVVETAVILFNISWLVYTYGTIGFRPATPSNFGDSRYTVFAHVKLPELDVHALILDGVDRIVVGFKGSNSSLNSAVDQADSLTPLLVSYQGAQSPTKKALAESPAYFSEKLWQRCRVHRGYATSYARIRTALLEKIQYLYSSCGRPIYFCGQYVSRCQLFCFRGQNFLNIPETKVWKKITNYLQLAVIICRSQFLTS